MAASPTSDSSGITTKQYTHKKLQTKTVSELKDILIKMGLTHSGKKAELIERILAGPPKIVPVFWKKMRATVYVVRHARQTVPGTLDPPIVKGQIPPQIDFDMIITSPYKRTRQTVKLFNATRSEPAKVYVDPRISEFHAQKHKPGTYSKSSTLYGELPGDEETWDEFKARVEKFLAYLAKLPEKRILVVTHGLVVKYIYDKFNAEPIYERGRSVPFMRGIILAARPAKREGIILAARPAEREGIILQPTTVEKISGSSLRYVEPSKKTPTKSKSQSSKTKSSSSSSYRTDPIYFYAKDDPYYEFSNYYVVKGGIDIEGIRYPSTEHYYQSKKFDYSGADDRSLAYAQLIREAKTPNIARELASQKIKGGYKWRTDLNAIIKEYQDVRMREDWDTARVDVMRTALRAKFAIPQLGDILKATGDRPLHEHTSRDLFWGDGGTTGGGKSRPPGEAPVGRKRSGEGEDMLGKLLEEVRSALQ